VTAFIRRENFDKTGLTAVVVLRIENAGDRSARGIKATISHAETGCVAYNEPDDWERAANDGRLNPRVLRYRHALNPGDHSVIMGIPLCDRSTFPFTISIMLAAEDCRLSALHCQLTSEQITLGEPVPFSGTSPPASLSTSPSQS